MYLFSRHLLPSLYASYRHSSSGASCVCIHLKGFTRNSLGLPGCRDGNPVSTDSSTCTTNTGRETIGETSTVMALPNHSKTAPTAQRITPAAILAMLPPPGIRVAGVHLTVLDDNLYRLVALLQLKNSSV